MNKVIINEKKYKRFIYDKQFIDAMMRRYYKYIFHYCETGEVALSHFYIATDEGNIKLAFQCGRNAENCPPLYFIIAFIPLKTYANNHELKNFTLAPITISATQKNIDNHNVVDLAVDIIPEDKAWSDNGFKTVDDLPKQISDTLIKFSFSLAAIFAKIQTDSFKTKNKIERFAKSIEDQAEEKKACGTSATNRTQSKNTSSTKTIILDAGISLRIEKNSALHHSFTRRCEAWSVRGHYRHLKSGKIIYIRPHQKGKGRLKNTSYAVI